MKIIAIINARSTSSRLPEKCFAQITDDLQTYQIIIHRAKLAGLPVVFGTSDDASDDKLAQLAAAEGVDVFRGARLNKIKRWHDCLVEYDADAMVCIDGDDLAVDFDIARRVADVMRKGQADVYEAPEDIICGLLTYAFTSTAVEKMFALVSDPEADTDVVSSYIEAAGLTCAEMSLNADERGLDVRLTLDYPEDAEFFRRVYEVMSVDASGSAIAAKALELGLTEINWHRQADFAQNQQRFNEQVKI
jgi:spore coat polysaccharide biosynthesis protein SpsF (cytidylyltransferase family)